MSELQPETRALLDLGRDADDPADDAIDGNRRALALRLGGAALGVGAAASTTSKAVAAWSTAKVLALCGSVIVAGAAGVAVVRPFEADPPKNRTETTQLGSASSSPALAPQVSAAPEPEVAVAEPEPAPSAPRGAASARNMGARSIADEFELVRKAQKHLHRDEPRAALAVLAEHARRFPSGALSEEREASKVFALCQMGDAAAARAHADRFMRRSPKSPFIDRVRKSCR